MARLRQAVLALSVLLMGCGSAGYAVDSATSACRQNPAYCAQVAGEETVVPTLRVAAEETVVPAIRGAAEVASVGATLRVVLNIATKSRIEQSLMECTDWAHEQVNSRYFGADGPSRQQCKEELPQLDPCGRKVTRAMQLGTEKHELALQCAAQKLGALIPGRFSLEQRYRYDRQSRRTELVSPEESRALRQHGCWDELQGTLVPDVVIHTGNPLLVQAVYDFKFPCPIKNEPTWREYEGEHPYRGSSQGRMYSEALQAESALVAPRWGIHQRITP
jgi:hypothetical protein